MPAFAFTARSGAGRPVKGLRLAESEAALAPALAAEGLFLVRAEPAAPPRRAPAGRHRPRDLQLLVLHLAAYLEAGIPLLAALQDFRDPARPRLEAAAVDLAARLGEGQSLSRGMAAHPGLFRPVHVAMVRAGEASGRLDQALRSVLKLAERQDALRARVRKAAVHPLLVLGLLAVIVLLVCAFSLPNILRLLEEAGVPLPWVTRVFLALGRGLKGYGLAVLAALVLGRAGAALALRRPRPRLAWDTALLRLPVAGPLAAGLALARFAHALAALVRSGLPLVQALDHAAAVTGNARLALAVAQVRQGVEQGRGLAASAARTGRFPHLVVRLMAIGEQSGTLEETLDRAAVHLQGQAEARAELVFQVLDPVLKVALGLLLVFVATAVLLPLYLMIGSLNG
jgi:type II secretory pathway component PulF